jgi:3-oxocholest-4-en-26-oyl-CoA dehydrogenase beta subunit
LELSLTSSQILIQDSARSFVRRHVPRSDLVRQAQVGDTWDPGWFTHFRDAGWTGALVPAALGGLELDPLSVAVIFEELGRGAVPGPLLGSSVIAACLLRGCRQSEQRDAALTAIADGGMILIPALRKPETSWNGVGSTGTALTNGSGTALTNGSGTALTNGSGTALTGSTGTALTGSTGTVLANNDAIWSLTGSKVFVPYADAATHFLVSVTTPGDAAPALAIVPAGAAGITTRLLPGFIQANHEVSFDNVAVAETGIVRGGGQSFDDSLAVARVVVAAYQVGGMLEMLDMSVAHSNTRVQFGTPIGRFQRVQDHIIRLLNAMDAARWTTYEAAWAIAAGRNGVARSYLAGSTASDSYIEAANAAHEVHAAIGSDPRYGLTLYTRISRTMYELLGPPGWQRRQMADALDW